MTPVIVVFLSSQNSQKGPKCYFFGHSNAENLSASMGFVPWPPDKGLCLWTPLGTLPQTPIIDSLCTLAMCPPHMGPHRLQPPESNFFLRPWKTCCLYTIFCVNLLIYQWNFATNDHWWVLWFSYCFMLLLWHECSRIPLSTMSDYWIEAKRMKWYGKYEQSLELMIWMCACEETAVGWMIRWGWS